MKERIPEKHSSCPVPFRNWEARGMMCFACWEDAIATLPKSKKGSPRGHCLRRVVAQDTEIFPLWTEGTQHVGLWPRK